MRYVSARWLFRNSPRPAIGHVRQRAEWSRALCRRVCLRMSRRKPALGGRRRRSRLQQDCLDDGASNPVRSRATLSLKCASNVTCDIGEQDTPGARFVAPLRLLHTDVQRATKTVLGNPGTEHLNRVVSPLRRWRYDTCFHRPSELDDRSAIASGRTGMACGSEPWEGGRTTSLRTEINLSRPKAPPNTTVADLHQAQSSPSRRASR